MDPNAVTVKVLRTGSALAVPLPRYETRASAGMDIRASSEALIPPGEWALVPTGLCLEIPEGYEGQVRPRSGLALKHGVTVLNAPGTIDADYRGEVNVILINHGKVPFSIASGDRIAQLVFSSVTQVTLEETEQLETTERGEGGFGSTGTQ